VKNGLNSLGIVTASVVALFFCPIDASGARFPNAVEKMFVVTGDAAASFAQLLGMPATGLSSVALPLDKTMNDGDGPQRWNRVTFSASPLPTLTLAPYWLDLATALPNSRPGYYSFSSPFIAEDLRRNDPWSRMLKRLKKEPGWQPKASPQFQRCLTSGDKTAICIAVYASTDYTDAVDRNGYMETITIRAHH
jgi:hypothetical protein